MAKSTGIGDGLLVSGYDVSGDVGSISGIQTTFGEQDMTAIEMAARDRVQLVENGSFAFNNFFNDSDGEGSEARGVHDLLTGATPGARTTHVLSYHRGRAVGAWVANLEAQRFSYSLARTQSGSLLGTVNASSTGALERAIFWSRALTPFVGADVPEEPEGENPWADVEYAAFELGASSFRCWFHVLGFSGDDAVVKVQDSADGATGWADLLTLWDSDADGTPPVAGFKDYTGGDAEDFLRVVVETSEGFTTLRVAASVHAL